MGDGFGTLSGVLPNGGYFSTPWADQQEHTVITTETALAAAGSTLSVAVSAALAAPATGTSGATSMDANIKAALSAAYVTARTAGL